MLLWKLRDFWPSMVVASFETDSASGIKVPVSLEIRRRCDLGLSLRKMKKMRAAQRERVALWKATPVGPERLRLLVDWAHIIVTELSLRGLAERRRAFNASKDEWRGDAGEGTCAACGRIGRRLWHHIVQLRNGGTNSPKNLVRVCWPCHAVIHPHLPMTEADPITAASGGSFASDSGPLTTGM